MNFFSRHKRKMIVAIVIVCSTSLIMSVLYTIEPTIVHNAVSYVTVPLQSAFQGASRFVENQVDAFTRFQEIELENQRLTAENEALAFDNSRLRSIEEENETLSELLNIHLRYPDYPKIGAYVIATDPSNWYNQFTIDRGQNHGIREDMVVLGSGGLLGRVSAVGDLYATVVTLIDETSSIAVECVRTGDTGYVRGDVSLMLEGLVRMEHIAADAHIQVGDEVVTSHLSSIFPPGIDVGVITEVGTSGNGTMYALVKPAAEVHNIESVLLIDASFDKVYPEGE